MRGIVIVLQKDIDHYRHKIHLEEEILPHVSLHLVVLALDLTHRDRLGRKGKFPEGQKEVRPATQRMAWTVPYQQFREGHPTLIIHSQRRRLQQVAWLTSRHISKLRRPSLQTCTRPCRPKQSKPTARHERPSLALPRHVTPADPVKSGVMREDRNRRRQEKSWHALDAKIPMLHACTREVRGNVDPHRARIDQMEGGSRLLWNQSWSRKPRWEGWA